MSENNIMYRRYDKQTHIPAVGVQDGDLSFAKDTSALFIWDAVAGVQKQVGGAVSSVAGRTGAVTLSESDIANLVSDLAGKQPSLGFTPENVVNKDTDGTLAANSDTRYASQKAAKTYADMILVTAEGYTDGKGVSTSDTLSFPTPYLIGGGLAVRCAYTFNAGPSIVECTPVNVLRKTTVTRIGYTNTVPVPGASAYFGLCDVVTGALLVEIKIPLDFAYNGYIAVTPFTLTPGTYVWVSGSDETPASQRSTITSIQITGNVVTVTANNTYLPGQQIFIRNLTIALFLQGQIFTITGTPTPTSFTFALTHANYGPTADGGTVELTDAVGRMNGFTFDSEALNFYGFRAASIISGGHLPSTIVNAAKSGVGLVYNVSLTSNVVKLRVSNVSAYGAILPAGFIVGASIVLGAPSKAVFLRGQTLTITSISGNELTCAFTHADYTSNSDNIQVCLSSLTSTLTAISVSAGVATFTAANTLSVNDVVELEPTIVLGLQGQFLGVTSRSSSNFTCRVTVPDYPFVVTNIALTTNVVTVTCQNNLAVGASVKPSGIGTATYLNGQTLVVTAATANQFTANFVHANDVSHADTGTVAYSAAEAGVALLAYVGNNNYLYSSPTLVLGAN